MLKNFWLIMAAILILSASQVYAAKYEMYRDAISQNSFTLKYKILALPVHKTRNDALLARKCLHALRLYNAAKNIKANLGVIIVFDGNNRYMETMTTDDKEKSIGVCKLVKDGEIFNFNWDIKKGQKRFYGSIGYQIIPIIGLFVGGSYHSSKVQDTSALEKPYQKFFEEYSFGSRVLSNALAAITPPEKIIATADTPKYKFAGAGSLENNTTYEDFTADNGETFFASRFYFDGDKLIKIATINYSEGSGNFEKSVIEITEFSPTPDQNYLKLPATLKDVTKRPTRKENKK